jgi:ABC-type multidrug transport system fused ATPase/permease subunit
MREQWRLFSIAVIGSLVYGALTVADAWVLGWATDEVIVPSFEQGGWIPNGARDHRPLRRGRVGTGAGSDRRRSSAAWSTTGWWADYRRQVTRRYLELPMSWHHRHPTGSAAVQRELRRRGDLGGDDAAADGRRRDRHAPGGRGAMLAADVVLTLVGLVVFPLLFVINVGYQRLLSPRVTRSQELRAATSAVAHESFDGALVVATLGRASEETARFAKVTDDLRRANVSAGRVRSAFDPLLEALPNIGILLVVALGVERVVSGAADAGDVVQVAYLFTVIAFPVRSFGWVLGELPRSVVGWRRVRSVLDATGQMTYGSGSVPGSGPVQLSVHGVGFGYPGGPPVLRDVTFDVEPGRTVALVGLTGSGKSSLASLLIRLVDPTRGSVQVDGHDLRTLTHEAVADAIALVPQQTFLFDDTVRANVTLGDPMDDAEVLDALRVAQAEEFVLALPEGLGARLGERGATLSGGQRQRLALARALVQQPRLLVMDDATSALDPEVEARSSRRCGSARAPAARRSSWSPTARRPSRWPTRCCSCRTGGSSTGARTRSSCSDPPTTATSSTPTTPRVRRPRQPARRHRHARTEHGHRPGQVSGHDRDRPQQHRRRRRRRRLAHPAARVRAVTGPQRRHRRDDPARRRVDDRLVGHPRGDPADAGRRAARRRRRRPAAGLGLPRARGGRGRGDGGGRLRDEVPAVPGQRAGPRRAADQGVRHVHDLPVLTQDTERRGALVSRVTSDVDQVSLFLQFSGLLVIISTGQLLVATAIMAVYSWQLTLVVWLCFAPLLVSLKLTQPRMTRAYGRVRATIGRDALKPSPNRSWGLGGPGARDPGRPPRSASDAAIRSPTCRPTCARSGWSRSRLPSAG